MTKNPSLTARLTGAAGGATNLQLLLVCFVVLISMSVANPRFLNAYNFESMAFFLPELGILLLFGLITIPLGLFVFGRAESWAKRTGKLKRVG